MNFINQLHRARVTPFQRDKRLIWESRSVQESHTLLSQIPTLAGQTLLNKLTVLGYTPHSRGCEASESPTGQRQPAEVRTHSLTLIFLVLPPEGERREERARNPTEFNTVSVS